MQLNPTQRDRQFLGCGFLPPIAPPFVPAPWDHPSRQVSEDELDEHGILQTPTCIGYLRQMPEVREVTHARLHWEKGDLRIWTDTQPHEHLLHAITVLEGAQNELAGWRTTPASKGGGGPG